VNQGCHAALSNGVIKSLKNNTDTFRVTAIRHRYQYLILAQSISSFRFVPLYARISLDKLFKLPKSENAIRFAATLRKNASCTTGTSFARKTSSIGAFIYSVAKNFIGRQAGSTRLLISRIFDRGDKLVDAFPGQRKQNDAYQMVEQVRNDQ
jgi:hypothetical protein